jgi:hypothetical protein
MAKPRKLFGDRMEDAGDPEDVTRIAMGMRAPTYQPNSDIASVAIELIGRYPESLGFLANFNLTYLRRSSSRTDNEFHPMSASGAFIRSDRERAIRTDVDAGIWLQGAFWDRFTIMQRRAWVHSLLLRLGMTPKGALRLVRPDVAEFAQVARIYGPWADQLKLFAEGLDSHAHPAPRPAALARREATAQPPVVN